MYIEEIINPTRAEAMFIRDLMIANGMQEGFALRFHNSSNINEIQGMDAAEFGYDLAPNKNKTRYVLIAGNDAASHAPRLKVTAYALPGKLPSTHNHLNTISFFVTDEKNGTVDTKFESKGRVKLSRDEYTYFSNICRDNWNLIKLSRGQNAETCLQAMKRDINDKRNNIPFERLENGDRIYRYTERNMYGAPIEHEIREDLNQKVISDTIIKNKKKR